MFTYFYVHRPLANADVSFCPPCQSQIEQCTEEGSMPTTSTKINKMLDILDETRRNNPKEKTIIFSQFTSMLDLMEDPLRRSGFKYCRCKYIGWQVSSGLILMLSFLR